MANRYWVGGSATWDGTAGTKWALTSGGAGGQAVPTSSDDVFFDANSGSVTVQMPYVYPAYHRCNNFSTTGFTGTINHTDGALEVYGTTFTLGSGMTFTGSGTQIQFFSTGSVTITTNGITCPNGLYFVGTGGTYTFSGNLTTNGLLYQSTSNTLTVGANNVTCAGYYGGSSTGTLNMGSGLWTLTQPQITSLWSLSPTSTLNKQTANIKINSSATGTLYFSGGGQSYNEIWFNQSGSYPIRVSGDNTISNLKITAGKTVNFVVGSNQTISTLDLTGTAGNLITISSYDNNTGTILTYSIESGGINYADGDSLFFANGGSQANFTVTSQSGGVVTGVSMGSGGNNFVTGVYNTSSYPWENGTGCQIRVLSVSVQGNFTLTDTAGTNTVSYCNISNSSVSGGAIWDASDGTNIDGGNNTGWLFPAVLGTSKFFQLF